jgi:4-hydroxy-3-polyprenylbenzoate decarboxylase
MINGVMPSRNGDNSLVEGSIIIRMAHHRSHARHDRAGAAHAHNRTALIVMPSFVHPVPSIARDLRTLVVQLEGAGLLKRFTRAVDPTWEPGSLVKWMFQALPPEQRFGMLFENVTGSSIPLLTAAIGASPVTFAATLSTTPDHINATILSALRKPIAPAVVQSGPTQEVVKRGAEIALSALPIPTWTPEKDAGPYLTTMVVTKNATSGEQNTGVYRTQVLDDNRVIINLSPNRQGTKNVGTFHAAGQTAPIAWVIGAPPAVYISAVANLPYGQDEMGLAGALQGAPIELVRCITQDLLVPADAEIIIEGEILIGETATEGAFGEFAGYMSHTGTRPIARITAITHRRDPIYYGLASQMPPSESTIMQSLTNGAVLMKTLCDDFGDPSISDVFIDTTFGGVLAHGIIAMSPHYPGHGRRIGRLVAQLTALKRVTVVDADIDIRDPNHVDWALNSRYNPATDTDLVDNAFYFMDPALPRIESRSKAMGSKLVIDATAKHDPGTFSLPPRATMLKALDVWKDLGLPDFKIPKIAQSRIDRS